MSIWFNFEVSASEILEFFPYTFINWENLNYQLYVNNREKVVEDKCVVEDMNTLKYHYAYSTEKVFLQGFL